MDSSAWIFTIKSGSGRGDESEILASLAGFSPGETNPISYFWGAFRGAGRRRDCPEARVRETASNRMPTGLTAGSLTSAWRLSQRASAFFFLLTQRAGAGLFDST